MSKTYEREALEYLSKIADGGMRDALTMLDKCLAYSSELTLDNVLKALGIASYDYMTKLLFAYSQQDIKAMITIINDIYKSGADLKQFIKDFTVFVLDFCKYDISVDSSYLNSPNTLDIMNCFKACEGEIDSTVLLSSLIKLQTEIKWDNNPKSRIEAWCVTGE